MITLGLMRHGHTAWNRQGRIQGRTDIALDLDAIEGLKKLTLPEDWRDAQIVSSPLSRAVETAKIVAKPPQKESALIEMNWGDWEGEKGAELAADPEVDYRPIEEWGWNYLPPNGESPKDVWERLEPWLQSLRGKVLAVSHIGIMRILLARAYGWDFSGPAPFAVKRNRIFVLEIIDGRPHVAQDAVVRLLEKTR